MGNYHFNRNALFLFSLLFLLSVCNVIQASRGRGRGGGLLHPQQCKPRCNYRCSATSHRKPCMFFCLKCCGKCLCVPPGTYGNKQVCPCYNNWKTKEGGPKCP
ncbi:PREDICTED: gibberellin-regulated protein 5 [Tarenaya hassleriana]|uniref:gibberellin-regulated protein 5 n=1 Tax=Tarenaya hassleriana TaxID=28532 RepID=UPI00053C0BEB|nr:PREDICTED: gibberellin-regulated protein 5 [Tarenaya hassleriana]